MGKSKLENVTTDLSALAERMPTQRPAAVEAPKPKPKPPDEPITQLSLSLRKSLHKQLIKLAVDADVTLRAFVLGALKKEGLPVRDDDLVDLRRTR